MNEAPAPADRSVPLSDLARTSNRIALASFGGGLSARPREVAVRTTDRSIAQAALTVAATVVLSASGVNPLIAVGTCGFAGWVLEA
ncbi:MAG TPA: hypothetical protein VHY76_00405 [Acetobacteraceae bacterium]|nr:hypothetical protein [Acetobacteraceae bacterium]